MSKNHPVFCKVHPHLKSETGPGFCSLAGGNLPQRAVIGVSSKMGDPENQASTGLSAGGVFHKWGGVCRGLLAEPFGSSRRFSSGLINMYSSEGSGAFQGLKPS